jgi:hypothetical protein
MLLGFIINRGQTFVCCISVAMWPRVNSREKSMTECNATRPTNVWVHLSGSHLKHLQLCTEKC